MQKLEFPEAVDLIVAEEPGFDREAYFFLRDALDYTVKLRKKVREPGVSEHVSGQQLLEGIRLYALKQFGPMVVTVFHYWNVQRCEDFGKMVYSLIRVRVFGKTDTDAIEDFKSAYSFEEAFVAPFQPAKAPVARRTGHRAEQPATREDEPLAS